MSAHGYKCYFMVEKKCLECNNIFNVHNYRGVKAKFCSRSCSYKNNKYKITYGLRCNMLTLIAEVEPKVFLSNGKFVNIRFIKYKCDCGNVGITELTKFKNKTQKSCGCFRVKPPINYKHGQSRTNLYKVWNGMRQRCENPNIKAYKNYGAKGVKVCDEWKTFPPFYTWAMENGWKKGLHIDKDIKGDGLLYSPSSCILVTQQENNRAIKRR